MKTLVFSDILILCYYSPVLLDFYANSGNDSVRYNLETPSNNNMFPLKNGKTINYYG